MSSGDDLKREGIKKVSDNHSDELFCLQKAISRFLMAHTEVTSDDIYRLHGPIPSWVNKNIMGAAFAKHPLIKKTGEMVKSKRPEAHSRPIHVWCRK